MVTNSESTSHQGAYKGPVTWTSIYIESPDLDSDWCTTDALWYNEDGWLADVSNADGKTLADGKQGTSCTIDRVVVHK